VSARIGNLKKEIVNNNDGLSFDWVSGEPDSNIVIKNESLNVKVERFIISDTQKNNRYDTIGISESRNNAVVLLVNQFSEIGLIWEWRPLPEKWFWACVRGFSDFADKNNTDTAKRELIEEIGNCEIVSSKKIGLLYQNTTFYENPVGLVLVNVRTKEITSYQLSQDEGILDFQFFNKEEILEMIKNERIEDTFTLSALMKYFCISD
jgi:hypothetical protein